METLDFEDELEFAAASFSVAALGVALLSDGRCSGCVLAT